MKVWGSSKGSANYRPAPAPDVRCDHCRYMFPPTALGGCRYVRAGTTVPRIAQAITAADDVMPQPTRVGSWFATHNDMYVSKDRHTMLATIYPPGQATFSTTPPIAAVRAALKQATPSGVTSHL